MANDNVLHELILVDNDKLYGNGKLPAFLISARNNKSLKGRFLTPIINKERRQFNVNKTSKRLMRRICIEDLPYALIRNLSKHPRFSEIFFDDEFWHQKFIRDFNLEAKYFSWKTLYDNYRNIWTCGADLLGLGNNKDADSHLKLYNFKAKKIEFNKSHVVALDLNNNVWVHGDNSYHQLGTKNTNRQDTLALASWIDFKAKDISVGNSHTLVIDMEDNLWLFGILGTRSDATRFDHHKFDNIKAKSISAGEHYDLIIDIENNVWILGFGNNNLNQITPTQINGLRAKQVSVGNNYAMLVDFNDDVWVFGDNEHGQLGIGKEHKYIKDPVKISNLKASQVVASDYHSIVVDLNNCVWVFGLNDKGQLGLGDTVTRYVPERIPNFLAQKAASGIYHSLLIDLEKNLWGFGSNDNGQLGLKNVKYLVPTKLLGFEVHDVSAEFNTTMLIATKLGSV